MQGSGSADEKLWAADAARLCFAYTPTAPIPAPPGMVPPVPTTEQAAAKAEIERRCAGFGALSWPQRRSLEQGLRDAGAGSSSEYAQIHALAATPHVLSAAEMNVVDRAFYGGDPLLRREAAYAISGSFKDQAKQLLMLAALSDETGAPLSELEALDRCTWEPAFCGQQRSLGNEMSSRQPTDEERRTMATLARIREAIASKMPVSSLIALQAQQSMKDGQ